MVRNAAEFTHAVRTDNNHRLFHRVKGFGFIDARNKLERVKTERVFVVFNKGFLRFMVKTFGMFLFHSHRYESMFVS